jgi:hypothetical protein
MPYEEIALPRKLKHDHPVLQEVLDSECGKPLNNQVDRKRLCGCHRFAPDLIHECPPAARRHSLM